MFSVLREVHCVRCDVGFSDRDRDMGGPQSSVGSEPSVESILVAGDGSYTLAQVRIRQAGETLQSGRTAGLGVLEGEAGGKLTRAQLTAREGSELSLELSCLLLLLSCCSHLS